MPGSSSTTKTSFRFDTISPLALHQSCNRGSQPTRLYAAARRNEIYSASFFHALTRSAALHTIWSVQRPLLLSWGTIASPRQAVSGRVVSIHGLRWRGFEER